MKKCTYCGKEYPDDVSVCAIDAQPLRSDAPPATIQPLIPPSVRQEIADREHLKLLSIFHFIVAGLALLGIAFLCLHGFFMTFMINNTSVWHSNRGAPPPDFMEEFLILVYLVAGGLLVIACALNVLSGLYLQQRKHRIFSLVVAGVNCLQVPLGTILGVFTLIVLVRDSVRKLYGD